MKLHEMKDDFPYPPCSPHCNICKLWLKKYEQEWLPLNAVHAVYTGAYAKEIFEQVLAERNARPMSELNEDL